MYSKQVKFDYGASELQRLPRLRKPEVIHVSDGRFQKKPLKKRVGFPRKQSKLTCADIVQGAREYLVLFLNSSSIHGLNHLTNQKRHTIEILIWLFIVVLALIGVIYLSIGTWERYQDNPIVVSMERDRFSWNTSFPAATICPSYKINDKKLEADITASNYTDKEKALEFIKALAGANYRNFGELPEFDEIKPEEYADLIIKYAFIFEPSVSNSGATGTAYRLEETVTELGVCYSFNSKIAIYSTQEYWKKGEWNIAKVNETFFVHPLDGEVFANVVNMSTGFDLYIHGPEEVVDIASKNIHSDNGYFLQVYLTALTLFSSEAARGLKVRQRKCRFLHESNLRHSPVYSYTLCRIECRIQMCIDLCSCVPHFYRTRDGEKICDVKGLHCLAKHAPELITLAEEDDTPGSDEKSLCECLPSCDKVTYVVEVIDTREWFLGSNLQWGLKEYPRMRLKRDVLFTFADVLVYVGGMAGLFLGCSVLSFAEIIYFCTIRLGWFIADYSKTKNKLQTPLPREPIRKGLFR